MDESTIKTMKAILRISASPWYADMVESTSRYIEQLKQVGMPDEALRLYNRILCN